MVDCKAAYILPFEDSVLPLPLPLCTCWCWRCLQRRRSSYQESIYSWSQQWIEQCQLPWMSAVEVMGNSLCQSLLRWSHIQQSMAPRTICCASLVVFQMVPNEMDHIDLLRKRTSHTKISQTHLLLRRGKPASRRLVAQSTPHQTWIWVGQYQELVSAWWFGVFDIVSSTRQQSGRFQIGHWFFPLSVVASIHIKPLVYLCSRHTPSLQHSAAGPEVVCLWALISWRRQYFHLRRQHLRFLTESF